MADDGSCGMHIRKYLDRGKADCLKSATTQHENEVRTKPWMFLEAT